MLKRREVQVLRRAGHTGKEIVALSSVSVRTVRRIAAEAEITTIANAAERADRQVGRASNAEEYRETLMAALTDHPTLRSVDCFIAHVKRGTTGKKSDLRRPDGANGCKRSRICVICG